MSKSKRPNYRKQFERLTEQHELLTATYNELMDLTKEAQADVVAYAERTATLRGCLQNNSNLLLYVRRQLNELNSKLHQIGNCDAASGNTTPVMAMAAKHLTTLVAEILNDVRNVCTSIDETWTETSKSIRAK